MHKLLLATTAGLAVVATRAAARDGSGYIGLDGGILFPQSQRGVFTSTFTQSAQVPAAGTAAPAPGTGLVGTLPASLTTLPVAVSGGSRVNWKTGWDVDLVGGYDFGMFRVEGELGYKRSTIKHFTQDTAFGTAVAAALNPTGTTGTTFVFPTGDVRTFNLNNHVSVTSAMLNGLLDFGDTVSFSAGAGIGYAHVKELGESRSKLAWQLLAEARYPISPNIDIGLKYRYFRTGHLNFVPTGTALVGSTRTVAVANVPPAGGTASGTTNVTFTRTAAVSGVFDDHFASHSLLLSLTYNFGAVAAPPPPPPPPPPPAAPATQTCPDGSVIPATSTCPAPPPPPPPPPPPAQRGERGK